MATTGKSSTQKAVKKAVKKGLRKIPNPVKILIAAFLVVGLVAGAVACRILSKNDRFVLIGETNVTVELGTEYLYAEEGAEAVCFGMNCSGKVEVSTTLGKNAEGKYVIPTDEEGVYSIVYTVNALKFNGTFSGEQIKRVRTFSVISAEEDGRNG